MESCYIPHYLSFNVLDNTIVIPRAIHSIFDAGISEEFGPRIQTTGILIFISFM